MNRYLIKKTIEEDDGKRDFKAKYLFYNGKWREDTIRINAEDLSRKQSIKKFGHKCLLIN